MLFQGNVGFQSVSDGVQNIIARFSRFASLVVDEQQGRFYELASRAKMFLAANQAATALSTLSTTYTGFGINNPLGSGVMVSLMDLCVAVGTAPAGISNMHIEGNAAVQGVIPTSVTALAVVNALLGNSTVGQAVPLNAATLATAPTVIRAIGGGPNATGSVSTPFIRDEIAGGIVLLPGTFIGLGYKTTAVSVVASAAWTENPV